jgi:RNA polymerase sigma-70 factor (ECF subfamily)
MLTDMALVEQVAGGNRRAFNELVGRYQSDVRRFFLHQTLGDSQLSDDLAQDTFLKAYTALPTFRGRAAFRTWLMRIAYNVFYDHVRKQRGTRERKLTEGSHQPARDATLATHRTSLAASDLSIDLYSALALLRDEERSCITLQLVDGYDIAAIARIMQLKEGTVKSHLSRGKEKMANYLRKNGYDRRR